MDNSLPFEYQTQIEAQNRRRLMAEMLLKQTMGPVQMQRSGPIAPKISPLAIAAQTLGQVVGQRGLADAEAGTQRVRQQYSQDEQKALQEYLAQPQQTRFNTGLASQFRGVQARAQEDKKNEDKLFEQVLGIVGKDNPEIARGMAVTRKLPDTAIPEPLVTVGDSRVPRSQAGRIGSVLENPAPIPGLPNVIGQRDPASNAYKPLSPPPGTTVNVGSRENELGLDAVKTELKGRQEKATVAKDTIAANAFAADALQAGARAGGGQIPIQAVRKIAQAFNLNLPDTATTEQLSMAMGTAVLANAAKLRPASDTDIKILKDIVGGIATDPSALTKALAFSNAMALRELQGYQEYGNRSLAELKSDYARGLVSAGLAGYELPGRIAGPEGLQFETIKQFQNIGGNPEIFKIGGRAVEEGAQFNIDPLRGQNPKNAGNAPARAKADYPEGFDQLTPQQQARYRQLKGLSK